MRKHIQKFVKLLYQLNLQINHVINLVKIVPGLIIIIIVLSVMKKKAIIFFHKKLQNVIQKKK